MWLVESIAEHISFCLLSYSSIRCARPLSRHMRFMVKSVLRRSLIQEKGHSSFMCIISVREVLNFEFKDSPFFAAMKNSDDSLPCFSLGWGILNIRQDICQFFFNQIAFTVSLCVLGMYALFDAHEKSQCSFSVSQVLCTNWLFLLSYSWLVTRVKFSSRRWGRDSPYTAPLYDRFHWTWEHFIPKIRQIERLRFRGILR